VRFRKVPKASGKPKYTKIPKRDRERQRERETEREREREREAKNQWVSTYINKLYSTH
jgi:hypothetical protein